MNDLIPRMGAGTILETVLPSGTRSSSPAGLNPARPVSPLEAHDWRDGLVHYKLAGCLRHEARVRWILSYDGHSDLTQDEGLYAARRMSPSGDGGRQDGPCRHVTKRLIGLRYSASVTTATAASGRNS